MNDEINPQQLPLNDLAKRCAEETNLFFKHQNHDPKYCFELFGRAILKQNDAAWMAIIIQYKPSVARWVNKWTDKHPDFPLTNEDVEEFIAEAFERFWKFFTPEKLGKSQNLANVLSYLQMCANGAVLDSWRKSRRRQFDQELDKTDEDEEQGPSELEPTPEEKIHIGEFWELIKKRMKDQKEYVIVYATYSLRLSPREILVEYPEHFGNIQEIYECKANAQARIENDTEIREFFQQS